MRNLSYENEFCMQFHFHANQSHFHANQSHFQKNGFALRLALKQRHKGTRKWPILKRICNSSTVTVFEYLILVNIDFLRFYFSLVLVSIEKIYQTPTS